MTYNKLLESSYLARCILLNAVGIEDYRDFPSRTIWNAPPAFHFGPPEHEDTLVPFLNRIAAGYVEPGRTVTMDEYLVRNQAVAFLVIQHDRLLFERYYNGYNRDSVCTSFSVAKAFVSAILGVALH